LNYQNALWHFYRMSRISLIFVFLSLTIYSNSFSQNFVPNGSFEIYDTCPYGTSQIRFAIPWFQPNTTFGGVNYGSTDYFNSCYKDSIFLAAGIPKNSLGFQYANIGDAYAGIGIYIPPPPNDRGREYLEVKLLAPLDNGKKYCAEFYVSLAEKPKYAVDAIGMYFSEDSIIYNDNDWSVLPFVPQVQNTPGNVITDTINWVKIKGNFIASGGEQFITIGNFKTNAATTIDTTGLYDEAAYYYIDDVSVYCCDAYTTTAEAGENKTVCTKDSVAVVIGSAGNSKFYYLWQPATGLNDTTLAQPLAKPAVTTTYYLTVKDTSATSCGWPVKDSVTVFVINCDTPATKPNSVFIPNIFSPNGDGNNDVLYVLGNNIAQVNLVIYNRWGERVFESTDIKKGWDGSYMGKNKESIAAVFIYYCKVIYADETKEQLKGNITLVK
jgi:gliding motility-associated-like protein